MKNNKLYKIIGVIVYTAVALILLNGDNDQAYGIMWLTGGLAGIVLLAYKHRLPVHFFGNLSCLLWILYGWWAFIIILAVFMIMGPIILLIAVILKPRRKCPNCKKIIDGDAVKCPYCASEIEPII
ncbi:MAG TPA: zinc ribbon domain-containing protein [Anaerolineae bacterium]|nr:zinc ribbon domain-containing protein [Anaerolineae bacterium]